MTQAWEYIKIALMNIRSNKGRSVLTMLGIIIGITSVIMILSIGDGVKGQVSDELNALAGGLIGIYVNNEQSEEEIYFDEDDFEAIREKIEEQGIENMYRVEITGFRDPDIEFAAASMDPYGNVIDVLDFTNPSYDFGKLSAVNKGNLLGRFIQSFEKEGEDGLLEEMALYEGVKALLETKRGS